MSAATDEAAHRVGKALRALDEVQTGKAGWHAVGAVLGHLVAAASSLVTAVELLEKGER